VTRGRLDVRQIPITADLHARDLDLTALSGLQEPVREVGGRLTAEARLRGRVGAPAVDGRLEWQDGKLVVTGSGAYDRVHLLVHGDGHQVILEELSAHAGTGEARVSAKATRGDKAYDVTSKLDLRSFPLYQEGQPAATLSLRGSAQGSVAPDRVAITTGISEARFALAAARPKRLQPLARPADIVLLADGEPLDRGQAKKLRALTATPEAPAPTRPRVIRIAVEAPRNVWVEGPDVHLELGLEPGFTVVATGEPRLFGTVTIKRGRLEVLGKRFDLDPSSTVRFTGPTDAPELSVKASYTARAAGITIQVSVEGPATGPTLRLQSPDNPQYGDTELLTVLATGHLPEGKASTATPGERAASLLGGVVASQLQKTLAKRLPLDVLTIEPGEGLSSTRLEAGTYIGDRLFVAYVGRIGADPLQRENRNEVQLEYQLTRRWSFEGTYGDARRGSADLVWTKTY
jgi:translocation and assembly module TamB